MLSIDGVHIEKDLGLHLLADSSEPILPDTRQEVTTIPGMHGALVSSSFLEPRKFFERILIPSQSSLEDVQQICRRIASLLLDNNGCPKDVRLIFDYEPDKFYIARFTGYIAIDRIAKSGLFPIPFTAYDPHAYEAIVKSVPITNYAYVLNDGTAETYPVFNASITQDTTHLEIINADKRVRLGVPATVEQTEVAREELVFQDTMASTQNWVSATEVDNGVITGTMEAGPDGFYASDYGAPQVPGTWQGPSLKKAIGTALQDFRADVYVKQMNVGYEIGMLEVYFLDANDQVVAKIGVEDPWRDRTENACKAQIGPSDAPFDFYEQADTPWGWNDFDGILRIQREYNRWDMYFAKIDANGKHDARRYEYYVDPGFAISNPVTQVQVAVRTWSDRVPTDQSIREIKIYRINDTSASTDVPFTFVAGDEVEINHQTNMIYLNGEPLLQLADLASEFFPLEVGDNVIQVVPSNVADVTMTYRRRYL